MKKIVLLSLLVTNFLIADESKVINAFNLVDEHKNLQVQQEYQEQTQTTQVPVISNNQEKPQGEFKNTVMNKVDEKMDKITKMLEAKEQQSQNQFTQASSLALPVPVGTTIITNGKNIYKEALIIDEMGNRYKLNNSNNNIIKAINTDFIAFKESDKKVPLLITKNDEKAEIKVTNTMPITNIAPNFKTPSINFDENILKELSK